MTDNIDRQTSDAIDQLSNLLKRGKPRVPAPDAARERAFEQLHAHWSKRTRHQRNRRRTMSWAVAASILIAVVIVLHNVNSHSFTPTVIAAKIVRSSGTDVHRRANRSSQVTEVSAADGVFANSTLITGTNSRLALAWTTGGSLRLDEATELNIVSPERVRLVIGSIYFDSIANQSTASEPRSLSIETPHGVVTHLGTQFSTRLQDDELTISVREGEVEIANADRRLTLSAGDEFDINRAGLREQRHVEAYGGQWQWIENIAPTFDSNSRSAYDLLEWIGRETGYSIHYHDVATATLAHRGTLTGMAGLAPMHALKALPYATDLRYDIVDGVINISVSNLPDRGRQTTPDGR